MADVDPTDLPVPSEAVAEHVQRTWKVLLELLERRDPHDFLRNAARALERRHADDGATVDRRAAHAIDSALVGLAFERAVERRGRTADEPLASAVRHLYGRCREAFEGEGELVWAEPWRRLCKHRAWATYRWPYDDDRVVDVGEPVPLPDPGPPPAGPAACWIDAAPRPSPAPADSSAAAHSRVPRRVRLLLDPDRVEGFESSSARESLLHAVRQRFLDLSSPEPALMLHVAVDPTPVADIVRRHPRLRSRLRPCEKAPSARLLLDEAGTEDAVAVVRARCATPHQCMLHVDVAVPAGWPDDSLPTRLFALVRGPPEDAIHWREAAWRLRTAERVHTLPDPRQLEDPRAAYGIRDPDSGVRVSVRRGPDNDPGLDVRDVLGDAPTRAALATCYAEAHPEPATPVSAWTLTATVSSTGRMRRATLEPLSTEELSHEDAEALRRCLARTLRRVSWRCHAHGESVSTEATICLYRDRRTP